MSPRPQSPSPPEGVQKQGKPVGSYRLAWASLPAMLVLSFLVLLLFGVSWWTALVVALLLACPAVIAIAAYLGQRPAASGPGPDRRPAP